MNFTYKFGVTQNQLIYKIFRDKIDRTQTFVRDKAQKKKTNEVTTTKKIFKNHIETNSKT